MNARDVCINIDSRVVTADGQKVGKVSRVVVDPRTRKIVDLVVHWPKGLLDVRDVVIPIDRVVQAGPDEVKIELNANELPTMANFLETEYVPVPPEWFSPAAYPPGGLLWPAGFAAIVFSEREHENIPQDTVPIAEGTPVVCPDGRVGAVDEVISDKATKQVVGFVVRRGTLLTHVVYVPIAWVASMERRRVMLNRTKAEIEHLDERQAQR